LELHVAAGSLSLFLTNQIARNLKKDCKTVPISLHRHYTFSVTEITRPRYRQKRFCPTSARRKVRPRDPMFIIPSLLFALRPSYVCTWTGSRRQQGNYISASELHYASFKLTWLRPRHSI
jgi:hypothetical protein